MCADDFPGQGGSNGDERNAPYYCSDTEQKYVTVEFFTPGCTKFSTAQDDNPNDAYNYWSHMAYADANGCPSTHPRIVPEQRITIKYPTRKGNHLVLHDGQNIIDDFHVDFFNGWKSKDLDRLLDECLWDNVACGQDGVPG